ncbi:MAG: DUF2062 domain-containing protein [Myxococcales bacterium]|nr:DUF2062 domain-containing protein [Myxococcales bacterium]MCB9708578.1 DUF2062 domain-containing protein [Myxococcales bacterium]
MISFHKIAAIVKTRVLGVEDTPHRIALSVFLGFFVGCTPLIGIHTILYLGLVAACRANKVAGLPAVFVTNPITAIPVYYAFWKLGSWVLHGRVPERVIHHANAHASPDSGSGFYRYLELEQWIRLWNKLMGLGAEVWVGSMIVGLSVGFVAYVVTYRMVIAYRTHKHRHDGEAAEHVSHGL